MRIDESTTVNAPAAEVFAALVSREFQAAKADRVGAVGFSMETVESAGELTVVTRRRINSNRLPEFVKTLVDPTITVVETEHWERAGDAVPERAEFLIDIVGAPVRLRGAVRLSPQGPDLCVLAHSGEVTALVPFFRDRVAEAAADSVVETIHHEADLLLTWVVEDRRMP